MMSGCSYEPCRPHAMIVQCTRFTHVTTLLWAFLAGRCHVLLLLAVLHSVMGIIVFSGLLLWFLSLLWACLSCYGILVCHGLSCSCELLKDGYVTWVLFCFYGMFSHLLALQWCRLLQKRLLFQQNLEWVVLKIPKLRWLASFLPAVLVQDRATSTAANYLPAYKSWKTWAKKHSASYLPADSVVFTLYIVSLI